MGNPTLVCPIASGETSLATIVRQKSVGSAIVLKILHKGEEKNVTVTLAELPS